MTLPLLEVGIRTDPGRDPDKQVNEDSVIHAETAHGVLTIVCDGMGGHAGGKEASELAIRTIVEIMEAAPAATPAAAALKRAIEEANARVWSMPTAEAGFRPGSTVVAALFHEDGAEVAHVGDSRLYLVHGGAITQVTRDHSMVQEMVDRKIIRAEDAAGHPDANKILRALGIAKEVEVDVRSEPIAYVSGDVFVLCSDGLSDLVEASEILEIAGTHPPTQAAGQLVDLANARGGHDNVTALVVRAKTSARARPGGPVHKTVPLTAHAPPPTVVQTEATAARTLVSEPLPHPPPAAPALPAHEARPSVAPRRGPIVAIGIALAIAAIAIGGAALYFATRPTHKSVPVVDDDRQRTSPSVEDDDRAPPEIAPAPTLSVEHPHKWSHDASHADPCGAVRRARERDASGLWLEKLKEKCRAEGGTP
jgi:PPM family protein phosphatase